MAKSWRQKFDERTTSNVKQTDRPIPGVPLNGTILISNPTEISGELAKIGAGRTLSIQEFRERLAEKHQADITCPLSTGIFMRIAAEVALENMAAGKDEVAPFWRVVEPKSPLAKKLSCGPEWIAQQRAAEGIA
jgi:hypothetical protein